MSQERFMDNKVRQFSVRDDIYKTDVLFIVGCNVEEFVRRMEKLGVESKRIDEYVIGTVIPAGKNLFRAVWVERFREGNIEDYANLIHELFHLVTIICYDKQIPIKAYFDKECGDEAAAYLLEFYTKRCLDKLFNVPKKKSKKTA